MSSGGTFFASWDALCLAPEVTRLEHVRADGSQLMDVFAATYLSLDQIRHLLSIPQQHVVTPRHPWWRVRGSQGLLAFSFAMRL